MNMLCNCGNDVFEDLGVDESKVKENEPYEGYNELWSHMYKCTSCDKEDVQQHLLNRSRGAGAFYITDMIKWMHERTPIERVVSRDHKRDEYDGVALAKLVWAIETFPGLDIQSWDIDTDEEFEKYETLLKPLEKSDDPDDRWIHEMIMQSHEMYLWIDLRDMMFMAMKELYEKVSPSIEEHYAKLVVEDEDEGDDMKKAFANGWVPDTFEEIKKRNYEHVDNDSGSAKDFAREVIYGDMVPDEKLAELFAKSAKWEAQSYNYHHAQGTTTDGKVDGRYEEDTE